MNRRTALVSLFTVGLLLSVLLVAGTIGRVAAGLVFAGALVATAALSRGFRGV